MSTFLMATRIDSSAINKPADLEELEKLNNRIKKKRKKRVYTPEKAKKEGLKEGAMTAEERAEISAKFHKLGR